jgi:hypothetical protein
MVPTSSLIQQLFSNVCTPPILKFNFINSYKVRRIHWLHACAQNNRWQEELVLMMYEMQWTVHHFLNQSLKWTLAANRPNIMPGPQAYAHRQSMIWQRLATAADIGFRQTTSQYQSPAMIT